MNNRRAVLSFAALIAVVVAANVLTDKLGLVQWLGLTATAGTWIAGLALVARDELDEAGGRLWVLAAILTGAAVTALFSPALAVASATAFVLSELADWGVYRPLRDSGRTAAAIASNMVGALVDTLIFLWLAGFPLDGAGTQWAVKVCTTTVVVLGMHLSRRR